MNTSLRLARDASFSTSILPTTSVLFRCSRLTRVEGNPNKGLTNKEGSA